MPANRPGPSATSEGYERQVPAGVLCLHCCFWRGLLPDPFAKLLGLVLLVGANSGIQREMVN